MQHIEKGPNSDLTNLFSKWEAIKRPASPKLGVVVRDTLGNLRKSIRLQEPGAGGETQRLCGDA